jgi:hypothetical protein
MRLPRFLSASAVAALFGTLSIAPVVAQDCSGDYEYVEQDCAGRSPGWFGQRPIRVKVVVRRPKFLMAPMAPAAPAGYALPAAPAAAAPAPAYAAPAMAMPMFTMMAAPAMAAPTYYQPAPAAAAAPAAASASPSLTDDQLRRLAELLQAAAAAPAKPAAAAAATCAPAAASAGLLRNCSESASDIQQLRRDVDDLIKVTNRLTAVVEKLVDERPAK